MIQPYKIHKLDKGVTHKVVYEKAMVLMDLLKDNMMIRNWLEELPAVTVIDCMTSSIVQCKVEDGTYPASCGHNVPVDMLLVAIKQFMVTCMKIAMGKELRSKFKGCYATHRFIFY